MSTIPYCTGVADYFRLFMLPRLARRPNQENGLHSLHPHLLKSITLLPAGLTGVSVQSHFGSLPFAQAQFGSTHNICRHFPTCERCDGDAFGKVREPTP